MIDQQKTVPAALRSITAIGAHATALRNGRSSQRGRDPEADILYPLNIAYAQVGLPVPSARTIPSGDLPSPYRTLLDHDDSMTLTLERHSGRRLQVRVLSVSLDGPWYMRRVLLAERSGYPVEMGAVRVNLSCFGQVEQERILRGRVPLGRILTTHYAGYRSRPTAFLKIKPNSEMMGVFWMPQARTVYGRRADLLCQDAIIGHVLEVLTPLREW